MAKKKKTTVPSALEQAQAEMEVKYKPQIDRAHGLLGEAADQYKSDIQEAKNNAAAIQAFAKSQETPTIDRYKAALTQTGQNEANVASALEGVGPASDILRRSITGTQGAARTALTGAGTRATQDLSDRQVAAQAGGIAAQREARTDYRKTQKGLASQITSLVGQRQADVLNRFGQIAEKDAANQTDIDVAKIAADARRDVAAAGATNAANKTSDAAAKAREKHVGVVRAATGTLQQSVSDVAGKWDTLASATAPAKNPDPQTNKDKPYLNPGGNPVSDPKHAKQLSPTPSQIKARLTTGANAIDSGILHIALLVRANKPLDAQAIKYIKANPNWRIPREWMPPRGPRNVVAPAGGVGGPGEQRPT